MMIAYFVHISGYWVKVLVNEMLFDVLFNVFAEEWFKPRNILLAVDVYNSSRFTSLISC